MEWENEDLKFIQSGDYTDIKCKKCDGQINMKFLQTAPPTWVVKCLNEKCENHKPRSVKFPMETMENLIPHEKLGADVWE
jgi:hypothetical protein